MITNIIITLKAFFFILQSLKDSVLKIMPAGFNIQRITNKDIREKFSTITLPQFIIDVSESYPGVTIEG